jgi:hypothetical protein
MLRSLGKRLKRFAGQGKLEKAARMEKRDAIFAGIEQELHDLASSLSPFGEKADSKKLVALSLFRNHWKSLFDAAQTLPDGEEKQRILEALKRHEAVIARLEQAVANSTDSDSP